jgi:flagellar motility protein MotE (MotC chaperone)
MKEKVDRQKKMFVKDITIGTKNGYAIVNETVREVKKSLVKETTTIADKKTGKEVAEVIVTYEPIHLD